MKENKPLKRTSFNKFAFNTYDGFLKAVAKFPLAGGVYLDWISTGGLNLLKGF
jgi:hypothetical protein